MLGRVTSGGWSPTCLPLLRPHRPRTTISFSGFSSFVLCFLGLVSVQPGPYQLLSNAFCAKVYEFLRARIVSSTSFPVTYGPTLARSELLFVRII
jgi:hypothetical protein